MKGGVYVYWVRKPGARYNIPWLSRHIGYVGQTSSFWHRHKQHMDTQPWADLDPVARRISLPNWRWLRLTVEAILIRVLLPAYNIDGNRHNPRRIPPWTAKRQRQVRDRGRHPYNFRPVHIGLWFVLAALVAYVEWRAGR